MLIGYARTALSSRWPASMPRSGTLRAPAQRIFREQVSSVAERPQLALALDFLRAGDVLLVTKLDRLARSTANLLEIVQSIEAKGATLRILDLNLDTATATGRLMLTMFGAIAQFEREMMLERQREGIAKAKAGQVQGPQADGEGEGDRRAGAASGRRRRD